MSYALKVAPLEASAVRMLHASPCTAPLLPPLLTFPVKTQTMDGIMDTLFSKFGINPARGCLFIEIAT